MWWPLSLSFENMGALAKWWWTHFIYMILMCDVSINLIFIPNLVQHQLFRARNNINNNDNVDSRHQKKAIAFHCVGLNGIRGWMVSSVLLFSRRVFLSPKTNGNSGSKTCFLHTEHPICSYTYSLKCILKLLLGHSYNVSVLQNIVVAVYGVDNFTGN